MCVGILWYRVEYRWIGDVDVDIPLPLIPQPRSKKSLLYPQDAKTLISTWHTPLAFAKPAQHIPSQILSTPPQSNSPEVHHTRDQNSKTPHKLQLQLQLQLPPITVTRAAPPTARVNPKPYSQGKGGPPSDPQTFTRHACVYGKSAVMCPVSCGVVWCRVVSYSM